MALETASNPTTGETVVLVNNEWIPAAETATNPDTGATAYLVNNKWLVKEPPPKAPASIRDTAVSLAQGVVGAGKSLSDVFGADTALSGALGNIQQSLGESYTPERQAELQRRAVTTEAASKSGSAMEEVSAFLGGVKEAPLQSLMQGMGSLAPYLATGLVGLGAKTVTAVNQLVGLAQGAGTIKGTTYDNVKAELIRQKVSPAEAEARAAKAQETLGENFLNIAAGAMLGAAGARFGVENLLSKAGAAKANAKLLPRVGTAIVGEAPLEGAQAGQEQYASNIALQREGIDTPAFQGVLGAAARDAAIGAMTAGTVGAVRGPGAPPSSPGTQQGDGSIEAIPQEPIVPVAPPVAEDPLQAPFEVSVEDVTRRLQEEYVKRNSPVDPAAQAQINVKQAEFDKRAAEIADMQSRFKSLSPKDRAYLKNKRKANATLATEIEALKANLAPVAAPVAAPEPAVAAAVDPAAILAAKAQAQAPAGEQVNIYDDNIAVSVDDLKASNANPNKTKLPASAKTGSGRPATGDGVSVSPPSAEGSPAPDAGGLGVGANQPSAAKPDVGKVVQPGALGLNQPFVDSNRVMAITEVNGVRVPFYISTGSGGKASVPTGKWYPFFGIGKDGWFNKGSEKEINDFYGSAALKAKAEELNKQHGDIRERMDDGTLPFAWDGKAPRNQWSTYVRADVNAGLNPVPNTGRSEAWSNNVNSLLAKINKAPSKPNTKFIPTDEYQEVPKGAVMPPGLEYKFNLKTQKNYARLPPQAAGLKATVVKPTAEEAAKQAAAEKQKQDQLAAIPKRVIKKSAKGQAAADAKKEADDAASAAAFANKIDAANPEPETAAETVSNESDITKSVNAIKAATTSKTGMEQFRNNLDFLTSDPTGKAQNRLPKLIAEKWVTEEQIAASIRRNDYLENKGNVREEVDLVVRIDKLTDTISDIDSLFKNAVEDDDTALQTELTSRGKAVKAELADLKKSAKAQNIDLSAPRIDVKHIRKSQGEFAEPTGNTRAAIVTSLKSAFKTSAGFDNLVTVVQKESELPKVVLEDPDYKPGTRGVAYEGKVYLVADNIPQGRELGVLLHEAGAHIGFDRILPDDARKFLADKVRQWSKEGDVKGTAAKEALRKGGRVDDEVIAYMVEELVNAGVTPTSFRTESSWLRRVYAAFNKFLKSIGMRGDITPQELVDAAYGAAHLEMNRGELTGLKFITARELEAQKVPSEKVTKFREAAGLKPTEKISRATTAEGMEEVQAVRDQEIGAPKGGTRLAVYDLGKARADKTVEKLAEEKTAQLNDPVYMEELNASIAAESDALQTYLQKTEPSEFKSGQRIVTPKGRRGTLEFRVVNRKSTTPMWKVKYDGDNEYDYFIMEGAFEPVVTSPPKSSAFYKWFNNSKAVYKNGEPLPVYHSTYQKFTVFSPPAWLSGKQAKNTPYWFSEDPNYGADMGIGTPTQDFDQTDEDYKKTYRKPMPVYISVQNPLDFRELSPDGIHTQSGSPLSEADLLRFYKQKGVKAKYTAHDYGGGALHDEPKATMNAKAIRAAGYDGVVMVEENGYTTWVVYDNSKIKEVANKNPTSSPDIRFSVANPAILASQGTANYLFRGPSAPRSLLDRAAETASGVRQNMANKLEWWMDKATRVYGNAATDATGEASLRDRIEAGSKITHIALNKLLLGGLEKKNGFWQAVKTDASYQDMLLELEKAVGKYDGVSKFADINRLFDFAATARREQELIKAGKMVWQTPEGIQPTLDAGTQARGVTPQIDEGMRLYNTVPEIKNALSIFEKFNNRGVDELFNAGVITDVEATQLKGTAGYVPWFRISQDKDGNIKIPAPRDYAKGLVNLSNMRDLEGAKIENFQINHVLDNMAQLSGWMTSKTIGNDTAAYMVDFATKFGVAGRPFAKKVGRAQANSVQVMEKGVPTYYAFDDPMAVPAFRGYESAHSAITEFLSAPANLVRMGVTAFPIFSVSQLPQDAMRAFIESDLKNPYALIPRIMGNFVKELFGGGTASGKRLAQFGIVGRGGDIMPGEARRSIRQKLGRYDSGMGGTAKKFWAGLERIQAASDAASRTALYELTMKETGNEALAIRKAREIINFDTQGSSAYSTFLRQTVPFMGVSMIGLNNLYKGLVLGQRLSDKEASAAKRSIIYHGTQIAVLTMLYTMLVGDTEDYKRLSDTERNRNFIIPGTGLSIPVPGDGLGYIFKVIPEQIVRYTLAEGLESKDMGGKAGRALWKGFTNIGSFESYIPVVGSPLPKTFIELVLNENWYTGNPIVGKSKEKLDPADQYTDTTSEIAKQLGKAMNLSPLKLDYIVRAMSGQMGGFVLAMSEAAVNSAQGKVTPPWDIRSFPGLNAFTYPDGKDRAALEDFYELRGRVDEVARTYTNMVNTGRGKEALAYLAEGDNKRAYALRQFQTQAELGLAKFRRVRTLIINDPTITDGAEMKRRLKELDDRENLYLKSMRLPDKREFAQLTPSFDPSILKAFR